MKVGLIYASVSSHIQTPSPCWFPLSFPHELLMSLRSINGHLSKHKCKWSKQAQVQMAGLPGIDQVSCNSG